MACYECHHCGACEAGRLVPVTAGFCPVCKTQNAPDAEKCGGCGMVLPKPPKPKG